MFLLWPLPCVSPPSLVALLGGALRVVVGAEGPQVVEAVVVAVADVVDVGGDGLAWRLGWPLASVVVAV